MKKKSKSIIKYVFIILIVLGGWYWHRLIKQKIPADFGDYTLFSQKLDECINEELISLGIRNENLLKKYQQQKKTENMCWLEITKEIKVPDDCSLLVCKERIVAVVEDMEGDIYGVDLEESGNKLKITCGRNSKIFQNLILWKERTKKPEYKIALVLDDLGYNNDLPDKFLKLNIPITFCILPRERYSTVLSDKIAKAGKEVLLHLPLEPKAYPEINPGPWAIFTSTDDSEIKKIFLSNLKSVPDACGVNNHMGSKFMENEEKLKVLLTCIKEKKGLFFLDSNTTNSAADKISGDLGLKFVKNKVFLDNKDDLNYIRKQLKVVYRKVLKEGTVVAIGHVQRKNTALALAEFILTLKGKNIKFIFVSELAE
ncbi:divergent polysaccharide deacetylase family protein [bacterium]|nr:divergent polysaccharide deacetylase family protein [bacterium]